MNDAARTRLAARLGAAVGSLEDPATPMVVVDLDAFDANAADLLRRAGGTPIRVASKSLRIPALLERTLALPGFAGVLGYALREGLWLVEQGISDDVVLAYPTVDRVALRRLSSDDAARAAVTLMVDSPAHIDLLDACRVGDAPYRVALDVDAGFRLGSGRLGAHVGPKRSPLQDPDDVLAFARQVVDRPGVELVGVMTYEGQVAGVQDTVPGQRLRSAIVRRMKAASMDQLVERRGRVAAGLKDLVELEFWNGGGSGSVEATAADPAVTEIAAGSGLLVPTLFDHYASFEPRPAAFYGVPVVRRPSADVVTVAGGGFTASGPAGPDRAPTPWAPPGLSLTGLEGAGEVQSPLTGPGTAGLSVGDWVWFRHAKSGELAEHTNLVHLVAGDAVVESVRSYRGFGCSW
ncbi:D-serine deaminase-like pyridoxal phosphate-dependent protein [Marmoricola sp. OAE513]|uniref:amino acid deaminase/aldolase n=1 Tax=Marmoricola sp. OAE513 TaxID=2817894 RepID=UPI001AE8F7C4